MGCQRMRWTERPTKLITKQAVAAIGQGRLMRVYDDLFSQLDQPIAQVLLSRENLGLCVSCASGASANRARFKLLSCDFLCICAFWLWLWL